MGANGAQSISFGTSRDQRLPDLATYLRPLRLVTDRRPAHSILPMSRSSRLVNREVPTVVMSKRGI